MTREVTLASYRLMTQAASLLSVGLLTVAIWLVVTTRLRLLGLALALASIVLLYGATRLGIRPEAKGERLLVLVSKAECPLCLEAKVRLERLTAGRGFVVQEVMMEDRRELRARFADWVPVLLWQQEEVAKGRWDWEAVERRLVEIEAGWTSAR